MVNYPCLKAEDFSFRLNIILNNIWFLEKINKFSFFAGISFYNFEIIYYEN